MIRPIAIAFVLLTTQACSAVLSSAPTVQNANGDSWYTEGTGFFGFMWGSKIYYCAPPSDGPAQCKEAKYVEQPKPKT
ncbi:MAG: hypothetical protein IT381_16915 [Deltaproteobacteria bacterium]|nr:hypothetical protein [Deltaproteobacteria bacterium]